MKLIKQLFARPLTLLFNVWELRNGIYKFGKSEFIRTCFNIAYENKLKTYGSWIGVDATFKDIPLFPHDLFGIFISGGSVIGKNCVIFQHVTIGSNTLSDSKRKGSPKIGDNCYIGAGAKIIGKVSIGNNCRIGANCVVYEDMPDNSVAVSSPTRIIQKQILNNRFYKRSGSNWLYYNSGEWLPDEDYKK